MDLIGHLEAFVAVAEARSFTKGAEACGAPQPVVSRRVSALERHLGTALLHRTSRRVELTEAGRTLLPHAADLVARAGHFHDLAAAARVAGLSVGIPPGPAPRALVAARRAAADDGVTLTFVEQPRTERGTLVRLGRLDVALLPCPPDEEELGAELGAATAEPEPGTGRTGPGLGSPAAGVAPLRGRRVHLDQLRRTAGDDGRPREVHLDAEDDVPWVRDAVRRAARAAGLRDHQLRVATSSTEALTCALEYGDVLVCTREWAAARQLRWRQLGGVAVRRSYAVASRPHTARELVHSLLPALALAAGLAPRSRSEGP